MGLKDMEFITSDQARSYFVECGLSYQYVAKHHFQKLRAIVTKHLKASGCLEGSLACHGHSKYTSSDKGGVYEASFVCKAFYFSRRQCISFERTGFIGFAGWSDPTNLQPILNGFIQWCDWMKDQIDITHNQEQN